MEERREQDVQWRRDMESNVRELQQGQEDIKTTLAKNNEMTEAMLAIFNGMHSFWNFCTKCSKIAIWCAKKGTILAAFIVGMYHAIDAFLAHDIWVVFRDWIKK